MSIAARNAILAGAAPGPTPGPRWLTFSSPSGYAYLGMEMFGTPPSISLEYSENGETWQPWMNDDIGGFIDYEITDPGARLYIRAADGGNMSFASDENNFWTFFCYDGDLEISGDVTSLLDYSQPVMSLAGRDYCFCGLFSELAGYAVEARNLILPSTTLAPYCYCNMLSGADFTVAPELPAMTLTEGCYKDMFRSATGDLTVVLPATTLAESCYEGMFQGAWMTSAPELPATNLAKKCYYQMFAWSKITSVVNLPATVLTNLCYGNMFYYCSAISGVRVAFTSWGDVPTGGWLFGAKASGTFYCPTALGTDATITRGTSNCPNGWTVINTDA